MKELQEIIKAYDTSVKAGTSSVLATVVHLEGSSYRRPGARMLVTEDGGITGAISGGCLTGDALRKAMVALLQRRSILVTYDSRNEEDSVVGMQLGCEGVIHVLFEPIDPADPENPVELLRKAVSRRQKCVVVTMFFLENKRAQHPGTCLLLEEHGRVSGTLPYPQLHNELAEDARFTLGQQASAIAEHMVAHEIATVFLQFLQPAISLVVVGAGNDAIPVMQLASSLGWEVRVIDGRQTYAKPQRFLSACQVIVSKPQTALPQIPVDDQTAFVLMTHNYNYDLEMLRELLLRDVPYIGILGPKRKLEKMLEELAADGVDCTKDGLSRVFGPVGLDIGAETAEEIALSIVAEIKTVFAGKHGTSLRDKSDRIHGEIDTLKTESIEAAES